LGIGFLCYKNIIKEHKKPNFGLIVALSTINAEIYDEFKTNVRCCETMYIRVVILYYHPC